MVEVGEVELVVLTDAEGKKSVTALLSDPDGFRNDMRDLLKEQTVD